MILNIRKMNYKKMNRRKMNKRGFFSDPMVDAFSFIAIIFIIIIFYVLFSFISYSGAFDIKGESLDMDAKNQLIQILKTETQIDGVTASYAEFVSQGLENKELQEKVKTKLTAHIKAIAPKADFGVIEITILEYEDALFGKSDMLVSTNYPEIFFTDATLADLGIMDKTGIAEQMLPGPVNIEARMYREN